MFLLFYILHSCALAVDLFQSNLLYGNKCNFIFAGLQNLLLNTQLIKGARVIPNSKLTNEPLHD